MGRITKVTRHRPNNAIKVYVLVAERVYVYRFRSGDSHFLYAATPYTRVALLYASWHYSFRLRVGAGGRTYPVRPPLPGGYIR